jgi:hypothetical protein
MLSTTEWPTVTDTSPEQLQKHADLIRAMSSEQRARALRAVDRGVRRLVLARLRQRHPQAGERELIMRHVAQIHGVECARRLYGELPPDLSP